MFAVRSITFSLLLISLIAQNEADKTVYDTYFNGHCLWSEEVSYHVHDLSGCKVYFTCQRGKFLDFRRCPNPTVFNIETHQCDPNGTCKEPKFANAHHKAWWLKVVGVIDEVMGALNISSDIVSPTATASAISSAVSPTATASIFISTKQIELTQSPAVQASSNLLPLTLQTRKIEVADSTAMLDEENILDLKGSVSMDSVTTSNFASIEAVDSSNTVEDIQILDIMSSQTIDSSETIPQTLQFVTMNSETQSSLITNSLYLSTVPPKDPAMLFIPGLGEFTFTKYKMESSFMKDFVMPLAQDILNNATVMSKAFELVEVLLFNADPLVYDIMDGEMDKKHGTAKSITLKQLKDAWNTTTRHSGSILKELIRRVHPIIFGKISRSGDIIIDYFKRNNIMSGILEVIVALFNIDLKYRLFYPPSPSDELITLSIYEIQQDIKDIQNVFGNAFGMKVTDSMIFL